LSHHDSFNSAPYNFMGLGDDLTDYAKARTVVFPIPYDLTLSYTGGARNGPSAIINASRQLETYDHDLDFDPSAKGITTLPELEPLVSGPEAMQDLIYKAVMPVINDNKFLLSLGGEHSITAALVKAYKEKYNNLSVVCIDAHSDLRDSYQGSKFSHACAMARVADMTDFVSVGVRSFAGNDLEKLYADNLFTPSRFRSESKLFEKKLSQLNNDIYFTIDLDGLDPSVIPAVGTPEPGGLLWDEVMRIFALVADGRNIVGADIVELSPIAGLVYPDFTAAKLAYRLIGKSIVRD